MKKHAFTLIELLIVLVIIGIIATMAVPQYQKLSIKARGAEAMTNLRALSDSAWRYYLESGDFPTDVASLDIKLPSSKYFEYWYSYDGSVVLTAFDRNMYVSIPIGGICQYLIIFSKDPSGYSGIPQKMDDKWYKFYGVFIFTGVGGPPVVFKPGWPGSDN